ncbi:hypothetical protein B4U79_10536 [Dinothrombium tinctorium]|uniref:VWFA domain-containing protein n=1 Tax=Dinothrombium tinctorium TaxID=1965070 RepID=A0A3S3RNK6_9ACAR|nr:hypothetical protein B4U79_11272 [Dinothrombium tinctorium]RWS02038.1 hypothetical protein B4U79_05069 [Dinothrombium tinctorium]RWS02425.1 hypothetical protein B4U79_10536 [Dinothrombium tinctorium]
MSANESYQKLVVPKSKSRITAKKFVEDQKLAYWDGCAYCELKKAEFVNENTNIVIENTKTGKIFEGSDARKLLGISFEEAKRVKLNPESYSQFRIFTEAKNANRALAQGSNFIYKAKLDKRKASDVDEDDERHTKKETKNKRTKIQKVATSTSSDVKSSSIVTVKLGNYSDIQIAFSYDTTGSMSGCIEQVKTVVKQTISRLLRSISGIQIAVIAHGDYCDEDSTYLIKYIDFSNNEKQLCDFITNVGHTGGGDFQEAYEYVLNKARTSLSWKEKASKSLVVIGDATPHGPKDFANKSKLDWRQEAESLKQNGIKVYSVRCLSWSESKEFYKELANITGGFYLELHQFTAISDFMIAISYREGDYQQLLQFREEVQQRNRGILNRNMQQTFATLCGEDVPSDATPDDLTAVEPGRFQVLTVDKDDSIKNFVIRQGAKFKVGHGYYEFTKPEEIQAYKNIVLMDKITGDMFTGDRARELANIPEHIKGKKVKPPPSDKWVMFIQSTSYNRKLIAGTKFLYEASKDPID